MWSPPPWEERGLKSSRQRTEDIAVIVQEIVDREGWALANRLAIIIEGIGKRVAESYDGDPFAGAPELHVEYETSIGGNQVDNPSFETNTDGWNAYSGATIQRVMGGVEGDFSLEIAGPAAIEKFGVNDSPTWIRSARAAGARYRFSAWVKSDTNTGEAQLRVREYKDRIKVGATTVSLGVILSPIWQLITVDYIAQEAGSTLDFQVLNDPMAPGAVFQVDDISIVIIP